MLVSGPYIEQMNRFQLVAFETRQANTMMKALTISQSYRPVAQMAEIIVKSSSHLSAIDRWYKAHKNFQPHQINALRQTIPQPFREWLDEHLPSYEQFFMKLFIVAQETKHVRTAYFSDS